MKNNYKLWTKEEDDFILNNKRMSIREISEHLQRTETSISTRKKRLTKGERSTHSVGKPSNITKEEKKEVIDAIVHNINQCNTYADVDCECEHCEENVKLRTILDAGTLGRGRYYRWKAGKL